MFYRVLRDALNERGVAFDNFCPADNPIAQRVLHDYGAMFVGGKDILPPPVCVFTSQEGVAEFQKTAGWAAAKIGEDTVELQPAAMTALLKARGNALGEGLNITPRDGAEAARRDYSDTVRLWESRFLPALAYWQKLKRLTEEQIAHLRGLPLLDQVTQVLELEKEGIFFSKDFSKSILYSIAAPGASQHIAMLAFDVNEFYDARVREILTEQGWFQTVLSDLPHFTFLGLPEDELPSRGLKPVDCNQQKFWIPDVG